MKYTAEFKIQHRLLGHALPSLESIITKDISVSSEDTEDAVFQKANEYAVQYTRANLKEGVGRVMIELTALSNGKGPIALNGKKIKAESSVFGYNGGK